jgi:membrane protein DedA with SNARE-associated domain
VCLWYGVGHPQCQLMASIGSSLIMVSNYLLPSYSASHRIRTAHDRDRPIIIIIIIIIIIPSYHRLRHHQ